jgi:hypothetical protein
MKKILKKIRLTDGKFWLVLSFLILFASILFFVWGFLNVKNDSYTLQNGVAQKVTAAEVAPSLDIADYNRRMIALANNPIITISTTTKTVTGTITIILGTTTAKTGWPVQTAYPLAGALLPFHRIVAYYGNFYSTNMGILGEYPESQVLAMLMDTVNQWNLADPNTPAIPAIDYIAVTAQGSPDATGKYIIRMPDDQIEKAITMAAQVNGIVFLDVQVGLSNVQTEVPLLEKYLLLPNVELAIDPEFSIKTPGKIPGEIIGTMDASDINFCIQYLSNIVTQNNLPPKILVVHRFTEDMVTNYKNIAPTPEVQVVMNMDGWGKPSGKKKTYEDYIEDEPVEFTGFKLFFKNDTIGGIPLMTPQQLLQLSPKPIYIQYQ